jgi:hypothetical protein
MRFCPCNFQADFAKTNVQEYKVATLISSMRQCEWHSFAQKLLAPLAERLSGVRFPFSGANRPMTCRFVAINFP